MSLETETVLDRRNLKRRLGFWRGAAVAAVVVAAATLAARLAPTGLADQKQIARIAIEGMITEDRDMLRLMRRVAENKNIEAVILTINSGGGTTTGGEALFEAIRGISSKKPVVAQFGTVAASAAYIAGLGTDHIVARGNSITGSVGVIFQWPEVTGLLDKVGVKVNEIKSGPLKAVPSLFEPISPAGRQVTESMVAESQRWFLSIVTDRRKIDTAAVPGLEQGRVYSGREALTHKLVDAVGGETEVLRYLEGERKTPKNLRIVDWKPRRDVDFSLWRFSLSAIKGLFGGDADAALFNMDARISPHLLDGLVSVWHPMEKQ
jgi:protease IV